MRSFYLIIIMMASALSCQSNARTSNVSEDSLAMKTVKGFYEWYINEAYPQSTSYYQVPGFKKLDETTYIFDLEKYAERINTIDYFSEGYKEKLIDRLERCNNEMRKIAWEYEPEPMFNINACNYLWGNQWVGGQGEKVSGFKIDEINKKANEVEVIVSILIGDEVFVRSKVLLNNHARNECTTTSAKKREGGFKIEDIILKWD